MRSLSCLAVLVLFAGCGASHEANGDGGLRDDGGIVPTSESSWIVTAELVIDPGPGPIPGSTPSQHRFTLHLTPTREGADAIAGTYGDAESFSLAGASTLRLTSPVSIAIEDPGYCASYGPMGYEAMEIALTDSDGDGAPDRLGGTASGSIELIGGDVIWSATFTATLRGELDREPPSLTVTSGIDAINPVDGVAVRASEPLPAGTAITLVGPTDENIVPLAPIEGRAATYATPSGALLAWGIPYDVLVAPRLVDLAGNLPASVPLRITTAADPGIQPEDGFEGGAHALLGGEAALVDATDGATVIAGARSLMVPPPPMFSGTGGGRITMRLAVASGESTLHLRYRFLANQVSGGYFFGSTGVHVRGAATAALPLTVGIGDADWVESGIAGAQFIGPPASIDMPLPGAAASAGEVVLDIDVRSPVCGGPLPELAGIMIDDVFID